MNYKSNDNIIIIEDGYNTCYLDSLLIALFYSPSVIYYNMLDSDPSNIKFIYLQELIKYNLIEPIRKNISVLKDMINEIRNFVFLNGFNIIENICNTHNTIELYTYLHESFMGQDLEFSNLGHIKYINLLHDIDSTNSSISIKSLLDTWMTTNNYYINNTPMIVPILLNRSNPNSKIDIMKQIKFLESKSTYNTSRWSIHGIVCMNSNNKYYTLIHNTNKWILFNNNSIPSLSEINITDDVIKNTIQKECFFLIYKYDD
jgi:hypothetical protein